MDRILKKPWEFRIPLFRIKFGGKMSQYTYFSDKEIEGLDAELVAGLDRARHQAKIPFIITCGVRTKGENDSLVVNGAVPDSAHMAGHAVDLRCKNSSDLFLIVKALLDAGFNRIVIGIKSGATTIDEFYHNVHVDNDVNKPQGVLAVKIYK